ncbi:MAG: rhodanese-like domain-containing protein [Bacteroidetes bacterium]|nr:rhodanese-like domain-containing protein [Bacteroidota bacterium]
MKEISCEELKNKIDQKDDFKLVNCLSKAQFRAKHIPGSINIPITHENIGSMGSFDKVIIKIVPIDEEVIVYCSDVSCQVSVIAYKRFEKLGYKKISRFSGGLRRWEDDGFVCAGEMVI